MMKTVRIMVAPLDWGLGHATRCIPVIDALLERGVEVILASSGNAFNLLKERYPQLEAHILPANNLQYSTGKSQTMAMIRQAPGLWSTIRKEQNWLHHYLQSNQLHAIISDHRLGMRHPEVESILIAHQIAIQPPGGLSFLAPLLFRMHWRYVNQFDQVWVPDIVGEHNLSGQLVPDQIRELDQVRFIGHLSHLVAQADPPVQDWPDQIPLLIILSGLEPQRSLLEKIIRKEVKRCDQEAILVQGLSGKIRRDREGNLLTVNFVASQDLAFLCKKADVVISRTGYSSLMDYVALGKQKLILIPTPGQTEQEYLAQRLMSQQIAVVQRQDAVDFKAAFEQIPTITGFHASYSSQNLLKKGLDALISRIMTYNS